MVLEVWVTGYVHQEEQENKRGSRDKERKLGVERQEERKKGFEGLAHLLRAQLGDILLCIGSIF